MNRLSLVLIAAGVSLSGAVRAAEPTALADTLIALEKQSWVAWQNHDAAFFEGFLSDDHVEMQGGGPMGKAPVVRGVKEGCTVSSYTVDHFKVVQFNPDTALLTYRAAQDTQCGAAKVPSPVWATSLFVLRGGHWQNALYVHSPAPK